MYALLLAMRLAYLSGRTAKGQILHCNEFYFVTYMSLCTRMDEVRQCSYTGCYSSYL